jgi:hypothetical protein
MVTHVDPYLRWTLAVIAGGGIAGAVQGTTVLARGVSLATTGGLGNPIVATLELGGSIFASLAALIAPLAALIVIMAVVSFLATRAFRRRPPVINPQTLNRA